MFVKKLSLYNQLLNCWRISKKSGISENIKHYIVFPADNPQIEKLKPENPYDIETEEMNKGGLVTKGKLYTFLVVNNTC